MRATGKKLSASELRAQRLAEGFCMHGCGRPRARGKRFLLARCADCHRERENARGRVKYRRRRQRDPEADRIRWRRCDRRRAPTRRAYQREHWWKRKRAAYRRGRAAA